MSNLKTLRRYQLPTHRDALKAYSDGNQGVVLSYCVGAGKTLLSLAIASSLAKDFGVKYILVLTPLNSIKEQFGTDAGKDLLLNGGILPLLDVILGEGQDSISEYFNVTPNRQTKFLATTYSSFANFMGECSCSAQDRFKDTLLIVDEGHHIGSDPTSGEALNKLTENVRKVRRGGGKVLILTGTLGRYDRGVTSQEEDVILSRTIFDQMAEGYAPLLRFFHLDIEKAPNSNQVVENYEESCRENQNKAIGYDLREAEVIEKIVADYKANGNPLAMVRIHPVQDQKTHDRRCKKLQKAFASIGVTSKIITQRHLEENPAQMQEWQDLKRSVNNSPAPTYAELHAKAAVLIFVQMADEGLDLPPYSTIYLWGTPRSVPRLVQLAGRVLRKRTGETDRNASRYEGYPKQWLDTSRLVFCLPKGDDMTDGELEVIYHIGAWLESAAFGYLLGRLNLAKDSFPRDLGDRIPSQKLISEYSGAVDIVNEVFEDFKKLTSDPLSHFTSNDLVTLLTEMASDQVDDWKKRTEAPDVPANIKEILREASRLCIVANKSTSTKEGLEILVNEELSEEEYAILKESIRELGVLTGTRQERAFSDIPRIQALFKETKKRLGLDLPDEVICEKVLKFHEVVGRAPDLEDTVPGSNFKFKAISRDKNWKYLVTVQFQKNLPKPLLDFLADCRQQQRLLGEGLSTSAYKKWYDNPKSKQPFNPIVSYYHDILSVNPSAKVLKKVDIEGASFLGKCLKKAQGSSKRIDLERHQHSPLKRLNDWDNNDPESLADAIYRRESDKILDVLKGAVDGK